MILNKKSVCSIFEPSTYWKLFDRRIKNRRMGRQNCNKNESIKKNNKIDNNKNYTNNNNYNNTSTTIQQRKEYQQLQQQHKQQ